MTRALITGALGLIGSSVTEVMASRGHDVVRADRHAQHDLYGRDLSYDVGEMIAYCDPDVVIHLAASPGRAFSEQQPRQALLDGIVATTQVAKACGRLRVPLVYASTSEVYGDHGDEVVDESTPLRPTSGLYGLGKLWGEQACEHYVDELLILRPLMAYGPGQRVGRGWAALPTFIDNAIRGERIVVHEGARRSWCYVTDVAEATCLLVETGAVGAYNVGRDDEEVEMLDVARRACDLAGVSHGLIKVVEPPEFQTVVKRVSCTKLYGTGWRPLVSLEQGMQYVYERLVARTA